MNRLLKGALPASLALVAAGAFAAIAACSDSAASSTPTPTPDAGAPDGDAAVAPPPAFACDRAAFDGAPLGTRCGALVDAQGRTVLLRGVNARVQGVFDVTFDDGRLPLEPIPTFGDDDAARLRALGFNALRLPLSWSALEPTENGGFVASYLDNVTRVADACGRAGVFVLLDLHQDAYSKEIGEDGAPYWAIVPTPSAKLGGPLTDLGTRRSSSDVLAAFDTFFGSTADGTRLRTRFGAMAAHVAAHFANHPAVVGLELFNEPVGSDDAVLAFHREILPVVRAAAPKKLVFFEPSVLRNFTDESPLGAGELAPGTVYAPHVYTKSFDATEADLAAMTVDTLRPSNASARKEADSYAAPLVITEYGFDPASSYFTKYIQWQLDLQDEALASSFLWLWKESSQGGWGFFDTADGTTWSERPVVVAAMRRARIEATAGKLASVAWSGTTGQLEAHFKGDPTIVAPNVVALGTAAATAGATATCDGAPVTPVASKTSAESIEVACGGAGDHVLVVRLPSGDR